MIDSNQLCVIIPVHKSTLNTLEITSLKQCKNILGKYFPYLVYPNHIDISIYKEVFPELQLKPVVKQWLDSIESYNKMKRSIEFYTLFDNYKYMLTYELDAYIFSDDWNRAHCFSYDYIGAPMFENSFQSNKDARITGGGNSGFSLRNIKACISVLKKKETSKKYFSLFSKLRRIIRISFLLHFIDKSWRISGNNYYILSFLDDKHINEDMFWGFVVPKVLPFTIGSLSDSIKFSFEMQPSVLYEMNNRELPIGCHAWEKYEPEFWSNYISYQELK